MFGFSRPPVTTLAYRTLYSRCCQHLRARYGVRSLRFHCYDSVLIYTAATDASPQLREGIPERRCCQWRRDKKIAAARDASIGYFSASLSMLLAHTKVSDDIRDTRGLRPRFWRWFLKKQFHDAQAYFSDLDRDFSRTISGYLDSHFQFECDELDVDLDQYTQPTAQAFRYVFGLASLLPELSGHREFFCELGYWLGRAIISFDCAIDWKRDKTSGQFNPLGSADDVDRAIAVTRYSIDQAIQACAGYLPISAMVTTILTQISDALTVCTTQDFLRASSIRERLGLVRSPRYVYANSFFGDCVVPCCCCLCCLGVLSRAGEREHVVHVFHHRGCN